MVMSPQTNQPPKQKSTRIHPPRLQHSPSLPNIWFPPHSGPIPPQFQVLTREPLQRPSTPPFPIALQVGQPENASVSTENQESVLPNDSSPLPHQARPSKIRTRHKLDSHTHPLLTPPLTPSSSLKAATSVESTASTELDAKDGTDGVDESTRFLFLSNISKQIRHDTLRSSIVGSLLSQSNTFGPSVDAAQLTEDSIKGFFFRCQETNGIVILAFFDVRHAKIAAQIITRPSDGLLAQCVGDEVAEDGTKAWITCRFVSAEELEQITGKSSFIASTIASFYVTAEKINTSHGNGPKVPKDCGAAIIEDDDDANKIANGGLDTHKLKSFLISFGDLRAFTEVNDTLERSLQTTKVFLVEYCDVRDANLAYATLNEQTLFGMKLNVFGREGVSDKISGQQLRECVPLSTTKDVCQSPLSNAAEYSVQPIASIAPPGQYSRTRERYQHSEETQPPPHQSPSPPYFYTSNATDHLAFVRSCNPPERSGSGEISYYSGPAVRYLPHNQIAEEWAGEFSVHRCPYQHECYFHPSRANTGAYECYGTCSTTSPYSYQQRNQPFQAPSFFSMHPAQTYAQDFDSSYLRPMSTTAPSTGFDHAMLQAPPPLSSENPSPDDRHPLPYSMPYNASNSINRANSSFANAPSIRDYLKLGEPLSTSSHGRTTRLVHPQGGARESRTVSEHNQVNLFRIEDGQDTRTTVMIKNIPNKMSDKDLISYIGKVCPRRIDFLYLRMDFKNGCNVGYAFVNFITVQDLLTFAKEKLGEKWNMFSSEKVLQMSYATYQGKEALVEKFKNSCIMDVQEAWRPKIFYSEPGPEQGLPEPFPAPTHIRRKERSALNRGALFVPSISAHSGSSASRRPEEMQRRRSETTTASSSYHRRNR